MAFCAAFAEAFAAFSACVGGMVRKCFFLVLDGWERRKGRGGVWGYGVTVRWRESGGEG